MNVETVKRAAQAAGVDAIHGDATHPDVLAAAGIDKARSFIVSVAGLPGVEESFRVARQQNPSVQILARATTSARCRRFARPARTSSMSGEGEVALAFTAAILQRLGATPDQIDRERTRVRKELESSVN